MYDKVYFKKIASLLEAMQKKPLDPVGQEDKDIDNDGDHDKSDKYLHKRRKAIGKAMRKEDTSSIEEAKKRKCKCEDEDEEEDEDEKEMKEEVEQIDEKAPPGAKYERMVKHIKKGYSKGGLTDKEKSIAYATAWKAKGKANEEVEQMTEQFVIHKGKHEPGRVSSLGGQTLHGVTVKDVYTNKKEAQAHADAINKGRGYKPGDEKNSLYGGVLYQVSPRKGMKEDVEQIDELSSKTLTSYTSKASKDAANKAASSVWKSAGPSPDDKGAKKDFNKARSRIRGVDVALKKLSKKPYKVESKEWGIGEIIPGTASIVESEDGQQFVSNVDVLFSHGVEFNVSASELTIFEGDRAKHYKKSASPEGIMDKESKGSKKFAAQHDHGKAELVYDDEEGHEDASKAGRITKQAPPRTGDQRVGHLKAEKNKKEQ